MTRGWTALGSGAGVEARDTARRARGALLLETVLAVSLFAMAGMAILSLVGGSIEGIGRSRDAAMAADLARSAMARLEAGLETTQSLNGPVGRWEEDESVWEGDDAAGPMEGFADIGAAPTLWEIEVDTEPSQFDGLTLATVRAFKRAVENSEEVAAEFTLRQLVRLGAESEDVAGEADAISEAADRGTERRERFGGSRPPRGPEERP